MMRSSCISLTVCASLTCALAPSLARAEPPDYEVAERLAFIERRLDAGTAAATYWSYGWFATYGVFVVSQYGLALGVKDRGFRADMAVGAVSSTLGVLPFALFPFTPRFAAAELRRLPEGTPPQRRRKLARAELLLKKSADTERSGRSWVTHVTSGGVAAAWGLVLALAYKRVRSGIINTVAGIGIAEAQIFTQPTDAIDAWQAYSTGEFRGRSGSRGPTFTIAPVPGGGVGARF